MFFSLCMFNYSCMSTRCISTSAYCAEKSSFIVTISLRPWVCLGRYRIKKILGTTLRFTHVILIYHFLQITQVYFHTFLVTSSIYMVIKIKISIMRNSLLTFIVCKIVTNLSIRPHVYDYIYMKKDRT